MLGRRRAASDLDIDGAGVAFVLGDGSHGEAVGVLLAAHECAGPGVQPICGRLEVDVGGIQIGPVPVPVDCVDGAGLEVAGQLNGGLAAKFNVVISTLRSQSSRSLNAELAVVGLVTIAVIVASRAQQNTALVASRAVPVPDKVHVKEALVLVGLAGAVEEDGAAIQRLLGLVLRQRRVAVLQVDEGDVVARSGFQHGELGILLLLVLVQDLIARVGTLASHRQKQLGDLVLPERVGGIASNPAASIALSSNHGAIRGNLVGVLNPGVSVGGGGESQDQSHLEANARLGRHSQHCEIAR